MKLFKIVIRILYSTLFLLTGCTSAGLSDCKNVTLQFQYTAGSSTDVFSKYIESVMLYVYDSKTGRYIKSLKITNTELQKKQAVQILLDPGSYDVICWGNVGDNTVFNDISLGESKAEATNFNTGKATTSDPLYFGRTTINVDPDLSETSALVDFVCAHIDIWMYTKGITDISSSGENISPILSVNGLKSNYDFNMQLITDSITYYPEAAYRDDKLVTIAHCSVLRFNENTSAQIKISKGSNGELIDNIDLSKFVSDNKIDLSGNGEINISILLEYSTLGLIIKVPNWDDVPVTPSW